MKLRKIIVNALVYLASMLMVVGLTTVGKPVEVAYLSWMFTWITMGTLVMAVAGSVVYSVEKSSDSHDQA